MENLRNSEPLTRPGPSSLDQRRFKPVKAWAALGCLFLAIEAWAIGNWIASDRATPTPTGPTPVPHWMKVVGHTWEVVGFFCFAATLWVFLIKPWRKERGITSDGMLCIVFLSLYWQDTLLNYTQVWNTYNAMFINFGSWNADIPGWNSPNGNLIPQPILWAGPIYVYVLFTGIVLSNFLMRKLRERRPQVGNFGLVAFCFGFFFLADLIVEPLVQRAGINVYGGAIRDWSLFAGTYYQFPLYEAVLLPFVLTIWAALRFFKDDRGHTFAERGADQLRVTPKWRKTTRFLALAGACNLVFLVAYNIPMQYFGLKADPWPADLIKRSYLTNGICGPGTAYACSSPSIPVPRRGSLHVDPAGNLVSP